MLKYFLLNCFLFLMFAASHAQFGQLQHTMEVRDSMASYEGREKIFIHYDKPRYQINDTMWLKGYVVSGAMNIVNDSSRIAYLEFIDANGLLVKRISTLCDLGLFYANITLGEALFSQGNYTLRAYTNRMRSFGDSLFFQSTIKIIDPKAALWKVTLNDLSFTGDQLFVSAALRAENGLPLANSRIEVALKSKNKALFRRRMITDGDGNIYVDTLLKDPKAYKNLRLEIANKELDLKIPLPENTRNIDLQFLPEGGSFVAGFQQQLGFKALDIYGRGIDVKGMIKDGKGNDIVPFQSLYKGMGIVTFTPLAGEEYAAYADDGTTYKLPRVEAMGWRLSVGYSDKADSIIIKVDINDPNDGVGCFITGSTRGYNYLKGRLRKAHHELKVATSTFPSGVARFTLYNAKGIAVNERALLVWHNDDLKLRLTASKETYVNKDSVALTLGVSNEDDEKVMGSFSVAVIDTSQVSLNADAENIISYMTLSADMKGVVETPYYYIKNPLSKATDALMLTQGWVKYDFGDSARAYNYEKEFSISGTVTNILNKPSPNTKVTIFGRDGQKGIFFKDTLTNKEGQFYFRDFPLFATDSVSTLIKAVNKREKSFGIGVDVVRKEYPPIPEPITLFDANNILFDTAAKKAIDRRSAVMEQLKRDGRYLEEVIVTAKARVPGSRNLNEDGGADQTITQSVLEQTPKADLLTVLVKQIPGFPGMRGAPFAIGRSRIEIIIDGLDLKFFEMDPIDVLQYYAAEDAKGIEVMRSPRYNAAYQVRFNPESVNFIDPPIFIEITTHGGVGPFLKKPPGMYLLKPDAPFVGRRFYSPRYASPDQETVFPDLRQTVYWNSDVVTNKNGEASISFYTSESKSSYLVIIQGSDLKGGFGTLVAPVTIKKE